VLLLAMLAPLASADEIDFVRDIRPILSENCSFCHGPDEATREADLRLDTADGAWGVIEKHHSAESEFFRRITTQDADELMPPPDSNRQLTEREIELIRRWIDLGAPWEQHWSFGPLESPPIPAIALPGDVPLRNPIDAFVRQQLALEQLPPSPEAPKSTLIRRLSLDLTGLPPTPDQVDEFLADERPDAYERLVERLLQSPHYGQRMAWDWLDAARYADTNGYQGDNERTMWPWRDWVVQAFNDNLPYDQFTVWQLAGDLLPEASDEQKLATGFCRNHMINGEGGRIAEENRVEYVMDMTETMGTVWLGMTLNCCRCHDHKYDPITNREYYQLFAIFNQTPVDGGGGDPQTAPNLARPSAAQASQLAELEGEIAGLDAELASLPAQADGSDNPAAKSLQDRRAALVAQRNELHKGVAKVMVMAERDQPRPSHVLSRGLYNKPADEVSPSLPAFLPPLADSTDSASGDSPRVDRLTLARWLVDTNHPLTARVTVNRFWQQVFGIGLVKTTEDFGSQGEIPVQMDLLNWLAHRFEHDGWDVKELMRLIVTSHTYRQSSRVTDLLAYQRDPENRLLARGARYRMPSWMLRDQALAAGGLLSSAGDGPAVNTYQPAGVWEEASFHNKTYQRDSGERLYRRSLYTFWRRIIAPTMFFDNASRQTCTVKVSRTNTPLHALQTLNNVAYVEAARVLAQDAIAGQCGSDAERTDFVMRRVIARPADPRERQVLLGGLERTRQQYAEQPEEALRLVSLGEFPRDPALDPIEHAAWTSLCLAVLNLDETLTRE
jgi:hypothetical protein